MAICKAFYLQKRDDFGGYAGVINDMLYLLRASVERKRTANDR
jgi:hypothetical protein